MTRRKTWKLLPAALAAALGAWAVAAEDAPKPAEPGTLVVLDAAGKEQKLKAWKFAAGTRRLGWLAPAPEKAPEKAPAGGAGEGKRAPGRKAQRAGPEALELRAEMKIEYAEGVLTLVPLARLRALDYDNDKETVTARVATGPKADSDELLTGTTKYRRINKLVIEAEVDRGEQGVAEIKFLGGVPRGTRAVRFPPPKAPAAAPAGRPAVVVSADGEAKTTHQVADLLPLYRLADGGERLLPTLMFRKTLKLDVAKIAKVTSAGTENDPSWQVTMKAGGDETLTLLHNISYEGGQASLVGLVGRVPAGYKLFPVAAIAEITFDATGAKPAPKAKDNEKKDKDDRQRD
jgi:hypothetical protein